MIICLENEEILQLETHGGTENQIDEVSLQLPPFYPEVCTMYILNMAEEGCWL